VYTQFSLKVSAVGSQDIDDFTVNLIPTCLCQWAFLAFFAVFEIGSLVCGVAPSSTVLIVGRAIAGIGVAGVFAGGLIIISSAIRPEKRSGML
jgi:MFS family permease